MTATTVTLDSVDPTLVSGRTRVKIELAGEDGDPIVGYVTADDDTMVRTYEATTDATGALSVALVPNSEITPSGTVYKVTLTPLGQRARDPLFISVPVGGSHSLLSLLTDPPGALPTAALAAEITRAEAAEAALQATLDAIKSGEDASLDTFLEIYTRFLSDESTAAALTTTVAGKVAKAGDTMTGPLVLPGNPTLALQAAPKQYVDTATGVNTAAIAAILDPTDSFTYNTDGTVATATENGVATTFTYDTSGRIATSQRAGGSVRTYTYNADGSLASVA